MAAGIGHHLKMSLHAARAFFLITLCVACGGCATTSDAVKKPVRNAEPGPPNAVMLDYMSPEEVARSREADARAAPPLPGTIGATDPAPRMRQTIVIGRNNQDPVWEVDGPGPAAYDQPAPQSRGTTDHAYRSGPVYYYRGGGGGSAGTGGAAPGTPRVGGDWPSAPSYGPRQMR